MRIKGKGNNKRSEFEKFPYKSGIEFFINAYDEKIFAENGKKDPQKPDQAIINEMDARKKRITDYNDGSLSLELHILFEKNYPGLGKVRMYSVGNVH